MASCTWTSAWSSTGSGVPCSLCTASPWAPTSSRQSECPQPAPVTAAHRWMGLVSPRGALSCSDSRCGSRGEMWILGERALLCVDTKCYSALYWNIHLGHAQGGRQEMSWADNPALGPHLSYPVIHPAQPGLGVILYYLLLSSFSLGIYSLSRSRTEPYFPRNSPKKVSGAMVLLLPNSVISPHPSSCSSLQAVLWRWSELGRVLYHCSPWTATAL